MKNGVNTNKKKYNSCLLILLIMVPAFVSCTSSDRLDNADRTARMAMSTASMWMVERHENKIEKGIKEGDLEEALEEAEELVSWIEGTPWLPELTSDADKAADAVVKVVVNLKAGDKKSSEASFMDMKMQFHHFHHELMEIVSEEHGGKDHDH